MPPVCHAARGLPQPCSPGLQRLGGGAEIPGRGQRGRGAARVKPSLCCLARSLRHRVPLQEYLDDLVGLAESFWAGKGAWDALVVQGACVDAAGACNARDAAAALEVLG